MKKLILITAVLAASAIPVFPDVANASAGGWRRHNARTVCGTAPAVVVQRPAAPTVARGQPATEYRSYSYEPGPVVTGTYRNYGTGPRRTPNAFGDATRKALGNY